MSRPCGHILAVAVSDLSSTFLIIASTSFKMLCDSRSRAVKFQCFSLLFKTKVTSSHLHWVGNAGVNTSDFLKFPGVFCHMTDLSSSSFFAISGFLSLNPFPSPKTYFVSTPLLFSTMFLHVHSKTFFMFRTLV